MKPVYEFADFRLDPANQTLYRDGVAVPLTPKVFGTLVLLVERSGQLVEKDDFIRRLWPDTVVEDAALAENVSRLRKALGDGEGQRLIVTVPKRGYRFEASVRTVDAPEAAAPAERAQPWWFRRGSMLGAGAMVLALAVTSYYWPGQSGRFSPRAPSAPTARWRFCLSRTFRATPSRSTSRTV